MATPRWAACAGCELFRWMCLTSDKTLGICNTIYPAVRPSAGYTPREKRRKRLFLMAAQGERGGAPSQSELTAGYLPAVINDARSWRRHADSILHRDGDRFVTLLLPQRTALPKNARRVQMGRAKTCLTRRSSLLLLWENPPLRGSRGQIYQRWLGDRRSAPPQEPGPSGVSSTHLKWKAQRPDHVPQTTPLTGFSFS